jgi:hypothetical protein
MDLVKIFDLLSQKMNLEWERIKTSLPHSGLKGTALEGEFKKFLREYLPPNLEISSGILIDSNEKESRQLDVIIHDAAKTPLLYNEEGIRVMPVECVYAVIEVKADIGSATEVAKIFENMKSVKDLEKKSYIKPSGRIQNTILAYGQEWEIWPVHYFVFALESMKLSFIADELNRRNQEENREVSKRVDCICVLNMGVIMNQLNDGMYDALPGPNSVIVSSLTKKPLLFFYRLIVNRLLQATMPPFQITEYMKDVRY